MPKLLSLSTVIFMSDSAVPADSRCMRVEAGTGMPSASRERVLSCTGEGCSSCVVSWDRSLAEARSYVVPAPSSARHSARLCSQDG